MDKKIHRDREDIQHTGRGFRFYTINAMEGTTKRRKTEGEDFP